MTKEQALVTLLRHLPTNMIAGDFADVEVSNVEGRDFPSGQQPGGAGVHFSFSMSWHSLGKTGKEAHDALAALGIGDR
ncbi:MAG: hypothetical protein OXE02_10670 [Chloroflexi bacterium]|nr:hypothetical protein [Chloroflexota bacterium]